MDKFGIVTVNVIDGCEALSVAVMSFHPAGLLDNAPFVRSPDITGGYWLHII